MFESSGGHFDCHSVQLEVLTNPILEKQGSKLHRHTRSNPVLSVVCNRFGRQFGLASRWKMCESLQSSARMLMNTQFMTRHIHPREQQIQQRKTRTEETWRMPIWFRIFVWHAQLLQVSIVFNDPATFDLMGHRLCLLGTLRRTWTAVGGLGRLLRDKYRGTCKFETWKLKQSFASFLAAGPLWFNHFAFTLLRVHERSGFHHLLPLRNLKSEKLLWLKSLLNTNKTKRKTKRAPQKQNHTFLLCCVPVLCSPNHFLISKTFTIISPLTCNHLIFNFFVSITSFNHFCRSLFAITFQFFLQSFLRSLFFEHLQRSFFNHFLSLFVRLLFHNLSSIFFSRSLWDSKFASFFSQSLFRKCFFFSKSDSHKWAKEGAQTKHAQGKTTRFSPNYFTTITKTQWNNVFESLCSVASFSITFFVQSFLVPKRAWKKHRWRILKNEHNHKNSQKTLTRKEQLFHLKKTFSFSFLCFIFLNLFGESCL